MFTDYLVAYKYKLWEISNGLKGILSTKIVIFSYPKLLSFSVLTFIKWRLTPSYAAKDTIFWQKRPKTIVIRIIVWMTIFKSIHMAFYVNTSWACALFRNNKQHVVLGQKRNCQRVEESGLWRIQRERWIEVKYLPNGTNAGYM
jgi:MFS superfamily sulfate permease-like transporter